MSEVVGEVGREGASYGVGVRATLQPGGDAGGEAVDVPLGEEKPRFVEVEPGEEVEGGAVLSRER